MVASLPGARWVSELPNAHQSRVARLAFTLRRLRFACASQTTVARAEQVCAAQDRAHSERLVTSPNPQACKTAQQEERCHAQSDAVPAAPQTRSDRIKRAALHAQAAHQQRPTEAPSRLCVMRSVAGRRCRRWRQARIAPQNATDRCHR